MGEYSDFTNSGGYNGDGLYDRAYEQPQMPKNGTYPTVRKPAIDPRDGWSESELRADFLENGFQ